MSVGPHAGDTTDAPRRRWPARSLSLLLVGSLVLGCVAAVVWSRAEVARVARDESRALAGQVAAGIRDRSARVAQELASLPDDCSGPSPLGSGGYAVVADGVLRCSVDLDGAALAATPRSPGLRFPPALPGRATIGVRSGDGLVVGVLPASDVAEGRPVGASWALLGPVRDARRAPVVPATSGTGLRRDDVVIAVGNGVVAARPSSPGWQASLRPLLLVALPLMLALALHRRVVVPLGRLAAGRRIGPASREVEEVAATCASQDQARRRLVLGLEETRAEERRRLAVQLHDVPVQELAGANMLLAAMDASGDWSRTGEVRAALRSATAELRRMSSELLPTPVARVGATRAVLDEVQALQDAHPGVVLTVDVPDPDAVDAALSGPLAGLVVRNVVEAVRNALEHAGGGRVDVSVAVEGPTGARVARATVSDDGAGLDVDARAAAERDGHIGMASMRSLVESAGGTFRVGSVGGRGTTVVLEIPVEEQVP